MKKKNILKIILIILFVILILFFSLYKSKLYFIKPTAKTCTIGIIDTYTTCQYDNVISNIEHKESDELTHGDLMIQFAQKFCPNVTIYYYDASSSDDDNKIRSENIIQALNWMVEKKIKYVNLSLSSSKYSQDLIDWIIEYKNVITIFASYSNVEQTADYPAMYEYVIASGIKNNISKKEIDIIYKSNRIKFINDKKNEYEGNSYLSIISTIKKANKN